MPSHTVAWVRDGGIVESIYIHTGSLKTVGSYLLDNVNTSNIANFMASGDKLDITDESNDLDESELSKSLNHLLACTNTDYIYILNRVGVWEVVTSKTERLNNLENVIAQLKQENEFTTGHIDVDQLKADIIDELMEILPEVILDKFDERMFNIFGIKQPTKH